MNIKKEIKVFQRLCALILTGILLGALLMLSTFSLPTNRVKDHVTESARLMEFEGEYPSLFARISSRLDNVTDSLMLRSAAFEGAGLSLIDRAMNVYYLSFEGEGTENLDKVWEESAGTGELVNYGRYWHGYLCFLRPALELCNYREIRIINLYMQVLLTGLICLMLYKRELGRYLFPFLLLIFMQSPYTTSQSLQLSSVYYVYLAVSLALVAFYRQLKERELLPLLFALAGMATAFLDLLTYPLVSFGVPLVFCLVQEDRNENCFPMFFRLLIAWGLGYAGMWAGKWLLGSLLTDENIIMDALESVRFRSSGGYKDDKFSFIAVFGRNFREIIQNPAALLVAILSLCLLTVRLLRGEWRGLFTGRSGALLLCVLLPLLWYSATRNHSHIHAMILCWREYLISFFALACWMRDQLPEGWLKRLVLRKTQTEL